MHLSSIELFAGAGGLALGSHFAGFTPRCLVEWNPRACETLRTNVAREAIDGIGGWQIEQADVSTLDFGRFPKADLLSAGVPCQPFSLGGRHRAQNDERDLFPEFARALRTLAPPAFVVENVKGLARASFRSYFSYVLLRLNYPELTPKAGKPWQAHLARLERRHTSGGGRRGREELMYNCLWRVLNAADYGVPQQRERVFIVGFRADLNVRWAFPEPTHSKEALLRSQQTGAYWERHGLKAPRNSNASRHVDSLPLDFASTLPWLTVRDAIGDLLPAPRRQGRKEAARSYPGHTGSFIDAPAKTIKAGVHGVPGGENMLVLRDGSMRQFTVPEAARLQTFPDTWQFEGPKSEALRQLGNAVPVQLAQVVTTSVAHTLRALDLPRGPRGQA